MTRRFLRLFALGVCTSSIALAMPPGLSTTPSNRIGQFPKPKPADLVGKQWLGTVPDHDLTPGVINTAIQAETICAAGFITKPYRHTTDRMISQALSGYVDRYHAEFEAADNQAPNYQPKEGHHEIDHLISLEFGGADDVRNLWPQPFQNVIAGSHDKDLVEDSIKHDICNVLAAKGAVEANSFLHSLQKVMAGGYTFDAQAGMYTPPIASWYSLYFADVQQFVNPDPAAQGRLLKLTTPLTYYATIQSLAADIERLPEPMTVRILPELQPAATTQSPRGPISSGTRADGPAAANR